MKTLAVIPARGGSKGIVGKNTREYRGLPLIGHAILAGMAMCDSTVVTTDDVEAARLGDVFGAQVIVRPAELAQDETPMLPVLQHVLRSIDETPERLVLLQPSSPSKRRWYRVREALTLMDRGADSVASVVQVAAHDAPDYLCRIDNDALLPFSTFGWRGLDSMAMRRQDCRPAYRRDGTVYVFNPANVQAGKLYGERCLPLVIPPLESVTLDTEEDWALAEARK